MYKLLLHEQFWLHIRDTRNEQNPTKNNNKFEIPTINIVFQME